MNFADEKMPAGLGGAGTLVVQELESSNFAVSPKFVQQFFLAPTEGTCQDATIRYNPVFEARL